VCSPQAVQNDNVRGPSSIGSTCCPTRMESLPPCNPSFTNPQAHTRTARALLCHLPRISRRFGPILRCRGTRGMSHTYSADMVRVEVWRVPRLALGMGDFVPLTAHFRRPHQVEVGR
jgi:hypothetical protein